MTPADIASRIAAALEQAGAREGGPECALISVNVEVFAPAEEGEVAVMTTRKTRTLLFLSAEYTARDGRRIATAASVHRIR